MPMDSVTQEPKSQEWGLFQVSNWHLHFCLWPRTCYLTGKRLWFKQCYKGARQVRYYTFVNYAYYIEKAEFIFWNLRGKR
jgi:hypothetical protein